MTVSFADSPAPRSTADILGNELNTIYIDGTVTVDAETFAPKIGIESAALGAVKLSFHSVTVGQSYALQVSENLQSWRTLVVLKADQNSFSHEDTTANLFTSRFYRIAQQP
jgi:hypothetical protein